MLGFLYLWCIESNNYYCLTYTYGHCIECPFGKTGSKEELRTGLGTGGKRVRLKTASVRLLASGMVRFASCMICLLYDCLLYGLLLVWFASRKICLLYDLLLVRCGKVLKVHRFVLGSFWAPFGLEVSWREMRWCQYMHTCHRIQQYHHWGIMKRTPFLFHYSLAVFLFKITSWINFESKLRG